MSEDRVRCFRCRHENPSGVNFCGGCGARLEVACAACGASNPLANRFCHGCGAPLGSGRDAPLGTVSSTAAATASPPTSPRSYTPPHLAEKILTSSSALEGERKQVTILFVDVSGFTGLSERLDPEDVHRLMARAFELMLGEVHRYEGTVNQFLGDGIMALFGAPIAHEDHARRATHAALGIRRALDGYQDELRRQGGISFRVRQGLNTGLVVVGSIGSDLRMDYTAVGDTTNVAARLQQVADPGRILVSEATHRLVEGYFYTRPLGELTLKGKAEPIGAWEVIGARGDRTRLDVEAERGLTPYVGREPELRQLTECFARARAGQGQVVFISGEPGIGKSRLLYEFRRRLGDDATWLEGRCISFGQSIALHPVIDMLKRNFRIEEGDTEEAIVRKVERGVLLLGEDLRPILAYLRYLLSVDPGDASVLTMDPQQRRGEIFDALRQLLVRASEVRPQVLVFEDVHWIDRATEESIHFSADSVPTNRILQILTYRTGYRHQFGERTYHTRIVLTTLSSADSAQIAQAVLAADSLPDDLQTLISRKAEGNPFFVEEVVKSLQETGVIRREGGRHVLARPLEEIFVPDSIQDVIMARIDRLEEAPKKTLQLASVIGREFTRRLLDRIADIRGRTEEFLRELKAIELIYEKALFPELAYMFKHALTHDVAYGSLLVQRRRELHRAIGLAIEELYADRLAEQFEVLAYHFAKGETWDRALDYSMKAAEKAARAFANREALALYEQAQQAAGHLGDAVDPRTLVALHQVRANLYFAVSNFHDTHAEAQRLLALAHRLGDPATEASALATMGRASTFAHLLDRALVECREALAVAERVDAKPAVASVRVTLGFVRAVTGGIEEAKAELNQALALSESVGDAFHRATSLTLLGHLDNWAGSYADAAGKNEQALQIAREHRLFIPIVRSLWLSALVRIAAGDYEGALAQLDESRTLSEKAGEEILLHRTLNTLGWLWIELGDLERAIDLNQRGAEGGRKRSDHETQANSEINLGDAFLARGDLALARETLEGVHRLVKDPATSVWMRWRYSTHLFVSLGDLWLACGDPDRAREFADQCRELAERSGARKNLVKAWRLAGEIATARRQWDVAGAALQQALAMAEVIGSPTQLWKTHVARGRLLEEMGKRAEARVAYVAAHDVIERVSGGLRTPALCEAFARSFFVSAVKERVVGTASQIT
jgi:class 3 adenylate cyclase/tetratricopeptide (TPR) repeat protein